MIITNNMIQDNIKKLNSLLKKSVTKNHNEIDKQMIEIINYIKFLESENNYQADIERFICAIELLGQDQEDIDALFRCDLIDLKQVSDIKIPLGRLKFVTSEINAVKLKEKIESENKEWEGWKKLNFAKYKKVIEIWKKHGLK